MASQSLSEEPHPPPLPASPRLPDPSGSLGVSGVNYLVLFSAPSPLQPYINTEPLLLKEARRSHGPTSLRVMSNALWLFLPLCRSEPETQIRGGCGLRSGERRKGPLTAFITARPWDGVGCSSAPMTQLAFLCASLHTDFCQSRAIVSVCL